MLYQRGKAYSQDLRERVFAASDDGERFGEVAELLRVSLYEAAVHYSPKIIPYLALPPGVLIGVSANRPTMFHNGEPFNAAAFIQPVTGYYSTTDGKFLSMPFNSSTPVLYWNKELFQKAGLDPNKAPATWPEVGEMGKKLVASGVPCGITIQWQTWTMLENFGAWHNLPFATKANGFDGRAGCFFVTMPEDESSIDCNSSAR